MRIGSLLVVLLVALASALLLASGAFAGGSWTVDTRGGGSSGIAADGRCDKTPETPDTAECTLQEALLEASAQEGATTIRFDIPWNPGCSFCIPPIPPEPLPITVNGFISGSPLSSVFPAGSVIDGTTQGGYRPGAPAIRLSPSSDCSAPYVDQKHPDCAGVAITGVSGGGVTLVKGLEIFGFGGNGIYADDPDSSLHIEDNVIRSNGLDGVFLASGNNSLRGNLITQNARHGAELAGGGDGSLIQGNVIGTEPGGISLIGNGENGVFISGSSGNAIGGIAAGTGNLISGNGWNGIEIEPITGSASSFAANDNLVQGNLIGTDLAGQADVGNGRYGVYIGFVATPGIGGNRNTIGGEIAGARNVISGNDRGGIEIEGRDNIVEGNRIGTDAAGTAAIENSGDGVTINGSNNTVGGITAAAANLISGNTNGITVWNGPSSVAGNLIGTQADGASALGNSGAGMRVAATGAVIDQNTIAFNGAAGIQGLSPSGQPGSPSSTFAANTIFSNGGLGIDLGGAGVTANESGDEIPPQNYPVLHAASSNATNVTVDGHLHSNPSTSYTLRFFSSPACDGSGFGEGKVFLGSTVVTTAGPFSGQGDVDFVETFPVAVQPGNVVAATATAFPAGPSDYAGTSEFSNCVSVGGSAPAPTVTAVEPASGPTAGGTSVTITGTGFGVGSEVSFGGTAATVTGGSGTTQLRATTPAHAAGAVDVTVTNPDSQSGTLAGAFTYVAPAAPTVTAIEPASGPTGGGTSVTITGTGFGVGSQVTFGGTTATVTGGSGTTQLRATTPTHAAGAVDVTVTNADGQNGTLSNGFTYVIPPTITSLKPTSGTVNGGTRVTILGTGFGPGAAVVFGGASATNVVVVSPGKVTCKTPAQPAGAVNVTITNPDGGSATKASAYTYTRKGKK